MSFEREREMVRERWNERRMDDGFPVQRGVVWNTGCSGQYAVPLLSEQYCFVIYSVAGLGMEGHRFPGKV